MKQVKNLTFYSALIAQTSAHYRYPHMSLAALSSGTVRTGPEWQTLESPFEWVPEQLRLGS